jgi:hypothetical protein
VTRGAIVAVVAAAVIAATLVTLVAVVAVRGGREAASPLAQALSARAVVSPRPVLFGDLVTARADLVVDRARIDPDAVRVVADFAPFAPTGAPRRTESMSGDAVTLSFRFQLLCLTEACVPAGEAKRVPLPRARVSAPLRDGGIVTRTLAWPDVEVARRVPDSQVSAGAPPWRLQTELPAVTYRSDPSRLANLLALAAALLAAAAAALVAWEIARLVAARRMARERRSVLDEALELVRESAHRSGDDRRRALALLSRVLARERVNGRLSGAAERLAWSRPEPPPPGLDALADEVEREAGDR